MKKSANIFIVTICTSLMIFLGVITFQAITVNKNWQWFIDFKKENNTISSYGSLAAAIVALLSTILLIYTILTQILQFKKQNEQFKKQFELQKKQFYEEKRRAEYEERKDMYFKLQLIDVFLVSFIRHIKTMSKEISQCFQFEKENPILHVNLQFDVNRDAERLDKMESLSMFKVFQHFFEKNDENWIRNFNDLFSILNFYDELLKEIFKNNKNHVKEKYDDKVLISFELNKIMEKAKRIALKFRKNKDYKTLPYYNNIENLLSNYNLYLKETEGKESDLNEISQSILFPFLESVSGIIETPNEDEFEIIDLMDLISFIRKRIYFIKSTALIYSSNMEKRYNEYFSNESEHLKKLDKIQEILKEKIESLNIHDL